MYIQHNEININLSFVNFNVFIKIGIPNKYIYESPNIAPIPVFLA